MASERVEDVDGSAAESSAAADDSATDDSAAGASTADDFDRDAVVVGGGASGLSAAVFLARYGFDVLVFDRGTSAIGQCYCVENYLGFLGIAPEQFLELGREHVRYEGGEIVEDSVVEVERFDAETRDGDDSADRGADGFRVRTQDGRAVATRYVVAAAAYDGDYLADLGDGDFHEEGDHPVAADDDGRTDVDGLYVAGWLSGGPHQVVSAAGHGARVAKALIRDRRKSRGYWDDVAGFWDWRVPEGRYGGEEWERHVDEWFDGTVPDDADLSEARIERVREELKRERRGYEVSEAERERRLEDGKRLLRETLFEE